MGAKNDECNASVGEVLAGGDEEVIYELRASMANTSKITEPKDEEDTAEPESSTTDLAKEKMRKELNID